MVVCTSREHQQPVLEIHKLLYVVITSHVLPSFLFCLINTRRPSRVWTGVCARFDLDFKFFLSFVAKSFKRECAHIYSSLSFCPVVTDAPFGAVPCVVHFSIDNGYDVVPSDVGDIPCALVCQH